MLSFLLISHHRARTKSPNLMIRNHKNIYFPSKYKKINIAQKCNFYILVDVCILNLIVHLLQQVYIIYYNYIECIGAIMILKWLALAETNKKLKLRVWTCRLSIIKLINLNEMIYLYRLLNFKFKLGK